MAISNNSTGLRPGVCTSTTRPTLPYTGQHIYETDTNIEYVWNGTAWVVNYVSAASPTFTGTITGTTGIIELGAGRVANGFSYIDMVGDTTYTDYGLRIIRNNNGADAHSQLVHRGTGIFSLITQDAGTITFNTTNTERMRINADGTINFTGVPSAPTATVGTNTTQIATTAFVTTADNLKANLASPSFSGTVVVPTLNATNYQKSGVAVGVLRSGSMVISSPSASPTFYLLNLPSGCTVYNLVSIVPTTGVNNTLTVYEIRYGDWSGVQTTTQIGINCALGNGVHLDPYYLNVFWIA